MSPSTERLCPVVIPPPEASTQSLKQPALGPLLATCGAVFGSRAVSGLAKAGFWVQSVGPNVEQPHGLPSVTVSMAGIWFCALGSPSLFMALVTLGPGQCLIPTLQ